MKLSISQSITGCPDAVIRFVAAKKPLTFSDHELSQVYLDFFADDKILLEHKQIRSIRLLFHGGFTTLLLAGFDSAVSAPFDAFREVLAKLGTELNRLKIQTVVLERFSEVTFAAEQELLEQAACTLPLCEYTFDRYLSKKAARREYQITVLANPEYQDALAEGKSLAESVCTARDLVNEMADIMTPEELALRCQKLGEEKGFSVKVLDVEDCEKAGMGLFLAVSKGSSLKPRLIVMSWNGGEMDQPPLGFVGKGITYDSGGLAIKTSGMESMRFDMNGAAAVIGAMCSIAEQKLPYNVVGVVAACENMVDANSYRNGDVIRSMSGKTVFVRNTDAEGRLTMADAMTWCIRNCHPSELIEVAGLTGSVCSFYGDICAAALTADQDMFERVRQLQPLTGEKIAQMPYFEEYRELLKSPWADLNNSPANGPGGILAGFFLDSFREEVPFLHIDFGAMPFTKKTSDGQPEGATGFGVKTLYYYAKHRCMTKR